MNEAHKFIAGKDEKVEYEAIHSKCVSFNANAAGHAIPFVV